MYRHYILTNKGNIGFVHAVQNDVIEVILGKKLHKMYANSVHILEEIHIIAQIDLPNQIIEIDLLVHERNFGAVKATLKRNNICFRWGTEHKIKTNENNQNKQIE